MAIEYVDLYCNKCALAKKAHPTTNYHGATEYQIAGPGDSNYDNYLLLAFEELSGVYRYRNIYGVSFYVTADRNLSNSNSLFFDSLEDSFDESTVTWETIPFSDKHFYNGASVSSGSGDVAANVGAYIQNVDSSVTYLHTVSAPGFRLHAGSGASAAGRYLKIYTNAAASEKRPYLHVAVSDTPGSVKVTKTAPSTTERFNCLEPSTFSWDIKFLNDGGTGFTRPIADIVQTSATFYWREVGAETWNEIAVSGDVRSVTVPANTFPGRDIQWRVTPVVVGYTVSGAGESSYQTAHPRIYSDASLSGAAGVYTITPDDTIPWNGSFITSISDWTLGTDNYKNLLAMFSDMSTDYQYKAIEKAGILCKSLIGAGSTRGVDLYFLDRSFDDSSVTWNTKPTAGKRRGYYKYDNSGSTSPVYIYPLVYPTLSESGLGYANDKDLSKYGLECLRSPGFMLQAQALEYNADLGVRDGSFPIYAPIVRRAILIDQTVTSKPQAAKFASGYVNRHEAQIFAWDLVPNGDYYCFGDWTQASAVFSYRAGTSGAWTTVSVSGSTQAVEIAANTLAAGTVQWKGQTTDDQGTTAESEIYTITTTDSSTAATPIAPINTIENGDAEIVFMWDTANDNGNPPTGADLQYSTDGSSWSDLGSVSGAATEYSAAAETFSNGTVYWRVRAYNADSVAGSWSDPVSFVCMAAPPMPVLSATEVPYATISWQSDGQQAYRITVDGKRYGPYFGTKKSFDLPDYLSDGQHTATVEVQGSSGLWSHPGSVTFSVTNVPGDPVALTGKYSRDAALSWSCADETADFLIYRDDVLIGHTSGNSLTDRAALGYHSYRVLNRLPGGYYTASNVVSGTMRVDCLALAPLCGGAWVDLALSENSDDAVTYTETKQVSLRQFAGRDYPTAERSRYKTRVARFNAAWWHESADALAFEAMLGELVIYKHRDGRCFVGVLSAFELASKKFYKAYAASVQQSTWREFTDADS